MQFSRIIIYLIFSLIFWECNNPTEISYNSDEERIIGSWNWTKTTGGFGGIEETPQSTGQTRIVTFDDENIVQFYIDDNNMSTYEYKLGLGLTIFSSDSIAVLFFNDNLVYAYSFPNDNSLVLRDNIYDGFQYDYERE